jgi:hypothetical protein
MGGGIGVEFRRLPASNESPAAGCFDMLSPPHEPFKAACLVELLLTSRW